MATQNVIKSISQPVNQSFDINVKGLNINTLVNVYYDNLKVEASRLEPRDGKAGDLLVTNDNGEVRFIYYVLEQYSDLIDKSEADFVATLNSEVGTKKIVVVDRASINTNTLPSNYTSIARCYAELTINKVFEVVFNDYSNYSGSKENAGSRRVTII